ncbi:MAG TPA: arginase family protein [Gemmatimonadaceae bacterium]
MHQPRNGVQERVSERAAFDRGKIALIGAPSSAGARMVGQEQAPRFLRRYGLVDRLRSIGLTVVDMGDLPEVRFSPDVLNPSQQNLTAVLEVLRGVSHAVDTAVANRAMPLVVGGDCTVTIGVAATLCRRFVEIGLLYFDADADLNTPETTLTGILDGMVLAHIIGMGAPELANLGLQRPLIDEDRIALFGYNEDGGGLDPVEIEFLRRTRMAKYPLDQIERAVPQAAAHAVSSLQSRTEHFLVHFDVDVIDAVEFPAVDVPHRRGLSLSGTGEALSVMLQCRGTVGLVVTEFNAGHANSGRLAEILNEMICKALSASDDG